MISLANRWWTYQRERFPVFAHGVLIAAFSVSAVGYSSRLRGETSLPRPRSMFVAFACTFLFFLQLRILDEFKDAEEDARYRSYRPVPRGLVTLGELGWIGVVAAAVQAVLAFWLDRRLTVVLAMTWLYLALMREEFFALEWLKARPAAYLATHMLVIPLITFFGTACDWLVAGAGLPRGLTWFLLASVFNAIVIEIGRKVRAPADEEQGVTTYSVAWGFRNAVLAWLLALVLTSTFALLAASRIGFAVPVAAMIIPLFVAATAIVRLFLRGPRASRARSIEYMSALWALLIYLSLGAAPLLLSYSRGLM